VKEDYGWLGPPGRPGVTARATISASADDGTWRQCELEAEALGLRYYIRACYEVAGFTGLLQST